MESAEDFEKIETLLKQGNKLAARELFLELEKRIKDPSSRLPLCSIAIAVLNEAADNTLKTRLCFEGAAISEAVGLLELQAQFFAKAAQLSTFPIFGIRHRRAMLRLAPGWFQFATESEKHECEQIDLAIQEGEKNVDMLFLRAESLAVENGNPRVTATILMAKAAAGSTKYLSMKMDSVRGFQAKVQSKFPIFRRPMLEYFLTLGTSDRLLLKQQMRFFISDYLRAAKLANEVNDVIAGYAYYNLAINLKSIYRFSLAKKYARLAHKIGLKHKDMVLLNDVEDLYRFISEKNNDIPDYLHGETRGE